MHKACVELRDSCGEGPAIVLAHLIDFDDDYSMEWNVHDGPDVWVDGEVVLEAAELLRGEDTSCVLSNVLLCEAEDFNVTRYPVLPVIPEVHCSRWSASDEDGSFRELFTR